VRIEGDKWKAAFTTHVGLFEPVVMFFGMTNSPATFQAMMNEILRDMINKGRVVAFVDDVLVGTETEEGHDEIVEEVLKRLEENNFVHETREMFVEGKEGTIFRSSNGGGKSGNRRKKGRGSVKVANTTMCQRCQEILRVGKLLSTLCERLFKSSITHEQTDKEG